MRYSLKADPIAKNRCRVVVISLILLGATCDKTYAQNTITLHVQDSIEQLHQNNSFSSMEDGLLEFFFYVQEAYYGSHYMYCDDFEKLIRYGETIAPSLYHRIMENITDFKIESDILNMRIFYKDDTLVSFHKQPIEPIEFCTSAHLRNYVRLFDEHDLVIQETNVYKDYISLKQNIIIILHEQYGYNVDMLKLPINAPDSDKKAYPMTMLFVSDGNNLRLHPLFVGSEDYINNDFKQHLVQIANTLCSKYNAKKIIFASQIMHR